MSDPVDLDRVRAALLALDIAAADPSTRAPSLSDLAHLTDPQPPTSEAPMSAKPAHVPVRIPAALMAEVEKLEPLLSEAPEIRAMGRFSQTLIVRLAVVEGLKVLRERYAPDPD